MAAPAPVPTNFAALAQGAPAQAPAFSLQSLMEAPAPGAGTPFANESFLQSQNASRAHIQQMVQNAANEIGRQNTFQLEQLGQLPSRLNGIYDAANQGFAQNANALAAAQGGALGAPVREQASAQAQMAPILAALQQQQAGALSNAPLLEAGIRELGTRQQGQLAMRGQELLQDTDKETSKYLADREGEERTRARQVEDLTRNENFQKEQQANDQAHAEKMAEIDHKYRMGELSAQQAFQAKEAEKQRAAEAAQAAANRKAEADRAAAEQRNRDAEYRAKLQADKDFGVDPISVANSANQQKVQQQQMAQKQSLESILASYGAKDTSAVRGAAIAQQAQLYAPGDPKRADYDTVLNDKDYKDAVSKIGKNQGFFANGPLDFVPDGKYKVDDLAKDLEKKGKHRSAALLRALYGDDSGAARDAILTQLAGG